MIKVLFVCLGNICRSPLAEGIFRDLVEQEGLSDKFFIDSAGTGDWHAGELPDPRTLKVGKKYNIILDNPARQIHTGDFKAFDYIIGMDESNIRNIKNIRSADNSQPVIRLLREFEPEPGEDLSVPDPYWGGDEDFDEVFHLVKKACEGFFQHLLKEHTELQASN